MVSVPPLRHGVAGVDHQVHQHLLDLARDRRSRWPRSGRSIRRRSMSSPISRCSIVLRLRDQRVQVEHLRLQHLPAAEGQQLPGQRGGALAGLHDLLDASRGSDRRGASVFRMSSL